MEKLGLKKIPSDRVITQELSRRLTELSAEIRRQIGLLIDRKGRVWRVLVGDARSVMIPRLDDWRAGAGRLRGLRLVHTHLKDEPLSREDLTDLALLRLDLIAAVGVGEDGLPTLVRIAHLLPDNPSGEVWEILSPKPPSLIDFKFNEFIKSLEDEISRSVGARSVKSKQERAYLVGKTAGSALEIEDSLAELEGLSGSCGIRVVGKTVQRRSCEDAKFVVGKGKLKDIVIDALQKGAGMMVFDTELSPHQVRALSDFTELKVIDRSQVILDIFAQRAKSREGKLQVELAQLQYALPRLGEKDDALSRLTGGIGGRGPGETKLEIDRRRIRSRIGFLQQQIADIGKQRSVRRSLRNRNKTPVISIVGYTNAGKSTLLNRLTKSEVPAEDKLFATLDPTSRRLRFPRETEVIVTDTVGFLKDLPEPLVSAFSATLDELNDADLLLHVIDVSNPAFEQQMQSVERLLEELDLSSIPMIRVLNKIDRADPYMVAHLVDRYGATGVSALDSKTFPPLIRRMEDEILACMDRSFEPEEDLCAARGTGLSS